MNLSKIFIERPIATTVIVAAIIIFGVIAFRTLPVNELPNVDFPTIRVDADLRGANPEVMASTVATPLERQFSQISGVETMNSVNTPGRTRITLQFSLERDIDSAAQDVQTAISQAMRRLPADIDPPTLRKLNPADAPVIFLALSAQTLPLQQLDDFANTQVAQRLSTINGVAQVVVFGSQKFAVRVYLDPEALSKRGLGLDKVVSAIQNANSNLPSGVLQGSARNFTVKSSAGLQRAQLVAGLGRDYHDRQVAIRIVGIEACHHLESIHAGHLEIEQDQVIAVLAMQRANLARIHRRGDVGKACIGQQLLQQNDICLLIVGDQDAGAENFRLVELHADPLTSRAPIPCSQTRAPCSARP